jgi:Domain of unknown function (DUF4160)
VLIGWSIENGACAQRSRCGDSDASHEALIDIRTLTVIRGLLPPRVLGLTLEWAALHRLDLMANWQRCETREPLVQIAPLV